MKFSCEKSYLVSAVSTASRAAAVKSAVPALEGLLIEALATLKISGYDLKTGIRTELPADIIEEGSIVVNARLFGDIIRKLPDDVVSVSVDDRYMIKITCGMSEFNIMGSSPSDYPELPAIDYQRSVMLPEKCLKSMIAQTNFAVSDNDSRPIQTGSLFEVDNDVMTVVAVDGYRLALRREKVSGDELQDSSFVVPGTTLSEIEKICSDSEENVKITVGSKHVMFTIGGTVVISRRLEGDFLNYKNAIPQTGKYNLQADKRALISAVERVSLIINDTLKSPVRCTFDDNVLRLCTTTALGSARDECEISGDGEGLEIGFNNRYLLDALKAAPADTLRILLSTSVSPCIIVPADDKENFLYMILPVRLKANEG